MKSQKSINRKAQKARERRKDYTKKRNVFKNNEPVEKNIGLRMAEGDGVLPKSKKLRLNERQKKENKNIIINALAQKNATARKNG